jgi:two-component system chemotaxis response regulator CheV
MAHDILLESGTNEVEVLEFFLGDVAYGINVSKVLQIVTLRETTLTPTPNAPEGYLGVLIWRDRPVPAYDLRNLLKKGKTESLDRALFVVTEFNNVINAFLTDRVNRIHRVGWDKLQPAGDFLSKHSSQVIGTLEIDKVDILMLDFEHIVAEINPETNIYSHLKQVEYDRKDGRTAIKVVFAEDSAFIRNAAITELHKGGYENIDGYGNGLDALEALKEMKAKGEMPDLILTDIEMPKMDGLTLCRRVREELNEPDIPVIFFSSLINNQMILKCKAVGGTGWVTKPDVPGILKLLDENSWNK